MTENEHLAEREERICELEREVAYYQAENARLQSQNEVLHETAWNLVLELRELKKQKEL